MRSNWRVLLDTFDESVSGDVRNFLGKMRYGLMLVVLALILPAGLIGFDSFASNIFLFVMLAATVAFFGWRRTIARKRIQKSGHPYGSDEF